ncbi:alpha/beta hydrolase [Acidovorax lacteus]|uniref:Alpha/beta fold hydrolase n=1 Tax=Acidovorax lacteus TaxID=1924988 RepID=A0ABP8L1K7_9BURK
MKRIAFFLVTLVALGITSVWYGMPYAVAPYLLQFNRSLSGLEAQQVVAAAHTIHYLDSAPDTPDSQAPDTLPVVLLHGIFAEKDHWVDFARTLPGQVRVLAPDIPGFGESTRLDRAPYDYAAHTERLAAWMDALGLERVHLAGNSMGGTVAALFALQHPQRVASVAFIGAPHGVRSPQPSPMDQQIDAGQRPLVAQDAAAFEAMMNLVFEQRPLLPYPILHVSRETAVGNAASNARLWDAQLKDRFLLQERLQAAGGLPVPTLVLWGAQDRVFDVSGLPVLQGLLRQGHAQRLEGIGHLPMMEDPKGTAWRYTQFLTTLQKSP